MRERRANTVPSNSVTTMSGVIDRSAIEPVTETVRASCHATQRHRRLSLPLSHTADTLGPAPTGDVTPLVKGPAGINTIGSPSKPYLAPTDGTPGPTFECRGSAAQDRLPCHHADPGPQNGLLSTHGSFHCGPVYPALGDKLNKMSRLKKERIQGNGDNTELGLVEEGPGASAEGGAGTAYHEADHEPPVFHQSLSCCTWSRSARIQSQSAACCMPCPRKLNVWTLC